MCKFEGLLCGAKDAIIYKVLLDTAADKCFHPRRHTPLQLRRLEFAVRAGQRQTIPLPVVATCNSPDTVSERGAEFHHATAGKCFYIKGSKTEVTRAFSLLLCTVGFREVRLFLRKSRVESGCLYTPEVKML
jgi:hypothetical protein